jgi:hypothetical protein
LKNILNSLFGISQRSKAEINEKGEVTVTEILSYDFVAQPGFSGFQEEAKRQQLLKERKEKINRLNNL